MDCATLFVRCVIISLCTMWSSVDITAQSCAASAASCRSVRYVVITRRYHVITLRHNGNRTMGVVL
jgi:hypothetical protein